MMRHLFAAAGAAALLGCAPDPELAPAPAPEFMVDGVGYAFAGERPAWASDPGLPARLAAVQREATLWFDRPLDGVVVEFVDADTVGCHTDEGTLGAAGCARTGHARVAVRGVECLESTALFHELGHAAGIGGHPERFYRAPITDLLLLVRRVMSDPAVPAACARAGFAL